MGTRGVVNKTFKEVRGFNMAVASFLQRGTENGQTKLGYAITKISNGQIQTILKEYQYAYQEAFYDKVTRVQVDNALTDKVTDAVLLAPKGSDRPYMYDKTGLNTVIKAERDFNTYWDAQLPIWDLKGFEIEPHYAVELPKDLTEDEIEAFIGFVIAPKE